MDLNKIFYESPSIEVMEIEVEKGFASSTLNGNGMDNFESETPWN